MCGRTGALLGRSKVPTLRQLEYLVAIADTRHFRRAAERVNTTQPTLSEQLKALEDRLGAQLVERSRSRVILTGLGEQVVEIARRMLAGAAEIRAVAALGGEELSGLVKLGLPPTIGPYLLPRVVPELLERHPDLKLYVREELPAALPAALIEGHYDVVITPLPVDATELDCEVIFSEPLYLAVSAAHPLAKRDRVKAADLAGEDVLALGPGHQLHSLVKALCAETGARLRLDYEGTSLDTLREMTATGLGVTFLPGLYVQSAVERDPTLRIMTLAGRPLYRTVGMFWRKAAPRRENFRRLAEICRRKVAQQLSPVVTHLRETTSA